MSSVGIDRETGKVLTGWPHVAQSLRVLIATRIGSHVLARGYGCVAPGLLGENITPNTILRFFVAVIVAVELWEPRFKIRQVGVKRPPANSPEAVRIGALKIVFFGEHRPRGHLGDPTPERQQEREFLL